MENSPLKQFTVSGEGLNLMDERFMTPISEYSGGGQGIDFAGNLGSQGMGQVAGGIGGVIQGLVGRGKRRDAQIDAQSEYDKMLTAYQNLDTRNLAANVQNQFAGMQNVYEGMENPYEDLTVNQQQAEFEAQQGSQQRANIMQGLRGAAGASGIAGLAQSLARQGQLQTQQASASIGQQESRNQALAAQGAMQVQQLQRGEASRLQMAEREGALQAEQMRLAGAERARGLQIDQTSTLLGMAQQDLAQKNQAIADSNAALYGGIGSLLGTAAMAVASDRKLKKNINLIGKSLSGLNIYSFEYINTKYGDGIYQGVMSDEIPLNAIVSNDGYDMVDYSMIDVEFKRIN